MEGYLNFWLRVINILIYSTILLNNLSVNIAISAPKNVFAYHKHIDNYQQKPFATSRSHPAWFKEKGFELGIIAGANFQKRTATLSSLPDNSSTSAGSNLSGGSNLTNAEVGAQIRGIIDFHQIAQPFIYLNAISTLGSIAKVNFGNINSPSTLSSDIVVANNWTARVGLGLQTEPLFNNRLQIGIGAAAAFINQMIKEEIGEGLLTSNFENMLTLVSPSWMALLSFNLCQHCIGGLPASLAAEFTMDRYDGMRVNGLTAMGNTYQASINQKWQPHADVLLSIGLPY